MFVRNILIPLCILLGQALLVIAAIPPHAPRTPKPMTMIGQGSSSTFTAFGSLEPHQEFSLGTLEDLAEDFWWWACAQENARTNTGACIVAVYGDRRARQYSASTIPRGGRGTPTIRQALEQEGCFTPVWAQVYQGQIKSRRRDPNILHAEDAALAQWEINASEEPPYAGDPIMAVYGDPGYRVQDNARGRINPCRSLCRSALGTLGVGFKESNPRAGHV